MHIRNTLRWMIPGLVIISAGFLAIAASPGAARTQPEKTPALHRSNGGLQRLTRIWQREAASRPVQTMELPLDAFWICEGGTLETRKEKILIAPAARPVQILRGGLAINAADWNQCVVTLRASAGGMCRINWISNLEPALNRNPGAAAPLFADGNLHTCTIDLQRPDQPAWAGTINTFQIMPSDAPAEIEITSIQLRRLPPAAPRRFEIQYQTREAFLLAAPSWPLTVPEAGRLDFAIGMLPRSWEQHPTDGVAFSAVLEDEAGKRHILLREIMTPLEKAEDRSWRVCSHDLGKWAGRDVTLHFETDHLGTPHGDYAVWGNPAVLSDTVTPGTPVILISCDTVRADHLSCYGYSRETTPGLDAFARESVLFENAIVSEPWTLPSHMTMLTGLHAITHGVTPNTNLNENVVTLPEVLSDAGYHCGGFTGATTVLRSWRGFSQGFDLYDTPENGRRDIMDTAERVEEWMNRVDKRPFFLFYHNYDAHSLGLDRDENLPYMPSDPAFQKFAGQFKKTAFNRQGWQYAGTAFLRACNNGQITISGREQDYVIALYDDAINCVDHYLARFLEDLKRRGIYDRALIIITSDHGEAFGEWDVYGHSQVYEPLIRVPLLIRFPGGEYAGRRIKGIVENRDLMPAILDYLGLPQPPGMEGISLIGLIEGRTAPRPLAFSCFSNWWHKAPGPDTGLFIVRNTFQTVRAPDWKYISNNENNQPELYHLARDPGEKFNRANEHPDKVRAFEELRHGFFRNRRGEWHLTFSGGPDGWRPDLRFTTESRFLFGTMTEDREAESEERASRFNEDLLTPMQLMNGRDARREKGARKQLILKPMEEQRHHLRADHNAARILVAIESAQPFLLIQEKQAEPVEAGRHTLMLNPLTAAANGQPAEAGKKRHRDLPALRIEWVPPETAAARNRQAIPRAMTPAEIEQLEALGYL
jgi:arylsulfatase A-like enzyme